MTPCISSQPGLPDPGEEQSRHCSSPGGEGTEGLALPSPRWHPAASSGAEDSHQGNGLPGGMVQLVQTLFCVCSPQGWLRDEGVQPGLPARPHLAKRSPRKKNKRPFLQGEKKKDSLWTLPPCCGEQGSLPRGCRHRDIPAALLAAAVPSPHTPGAGVSQKDCRASPCAMDCTRGIPSAGWAPAEGSLYVPVLRNVLFLVKGFLRLVV